MNSRKRNLWFVILAVIALLVTAYSILDIYGPKIQRYSKYSLCYVYRDSTQNVFGSVDYAYSSSYQTNTALYHSIVQQLISHPNTPELRSVFPRDTEVRDVYLRGTTLVINFSKDVLLMSDHEISLAKYCIAKTFSVFDNVSRISLSVEGKIDERFGGSNYDIHDYVTDHSQLHPRTDEITFYILSSDRNSLSAQRTEITWYSHSSLPQIVAQRLLSNSAGGAIPRGTKIISVYQNGGTVFIEFSPEFGNVSGEKGKLAIYSVVNTFASIPGVTHVVISLGGEMSSISGIALDTPLVPNMSYVYNK